MPDTSGGDSPARSDLFLNLPVLPSSEFEQNFAGASRNLTDFNLRVSWCSSALRDGVRRWLTEPGTARCGYCEVLWSEKLSDCSEDKATGSRAPLWRPFETRTSRTVQVPKPTKLSTAVLGDPLRAETPAAFQDIMPTSVKILGSPNSLFRPVKKKRVQCPYCDITFMNNGQLSGHVRIHTGDKPYKCDYEHCDKAFARNEELTRHKRIHSGERPHQCDICGKRFGRKDHLNKHRKTHLKVSEKKVYQCFVDGCGHRYTRSDALTRHQWTAHSLKHVNKFTSAHRTPILQ